MSMNVNPFLSSTVTFTSTGTTGTQQSQPQDASATDSTTAAAATTAVTSGSTAVDNSWVADVLKKNWEYYKTNMMANGEHVVSNNYGGTITEGQSYALMRALYNNDKETFDKTYAWTKKNMQTRPNDSLFAWQWGKKADGTNGVVSDYFATDADQDIAYALLQASEKWGDPRYKEEAMPIIRDLWKNAVVQMHGKYFINPGDWEGFTQNYQTLNPSYFAPYVYREFAKHDTANAAGWNALADNIYPTLEAGSNLMANGLPPNWIAVPYDKDTITFSDAQGDGSRNFGYDAYRVFWRMSMDAALGSQQAKDYLAKHTALLDEWAKNGRIAENYGPDGKPLGPSNSGFTLGSAMAQIGQLDPAKAKEMFDQMLAPHYDPNAGTFFNYYNDFLQSGIWLHLSTLNMPQEGFAVAAPGTPVAPNSTTTVPFTGGTVAGGAAPVGGTTGGTTTPTQLPSNIGVSADTVLDALKQATPGVLNDGIITPTEVQAAWKVATNSMTKEILGKMDYFVRRYNRTISLDELQKLAGTDNLVTVEDSADLPRLFGWG